MAVHEPPKSPWVAAKENVSKNGGIDHFFVDIRYWEMYGKFWEYDGSPILGYDIPISGHPQITIQ